MLAFAKSRVATNDWTIESYDENWNMTVVAEHLSNKDANATVEASNEAGHLILIKTN